MSYILEALKKSEKERKKEEIPSIQADHSSYSERGTKRNPLLQWSFVLILVAGGAAALWFLHPWQKKVEVADPAMQQMAEPAMITPEIRRQIEKEVRQAITSAQQETDRASTADRNPQTADPISQTAPPFLEDLPPSIRSEIPVLHCAGHVYSEVAADRMIIINGRIVREGDMVSDKLSLRQITREGVVLQFATSVFRVKLF